MSQLPSTSPGGSRSVADRFVPESRSFKLGRGAIAVVLVLAYVLVLIAYAQSTVGAGINQRTAPPPKGVSLHLVPVSLDAGVSTMTALMYVIPGADLVDQQGRLRQDLAVDALPILGIGTATFEAGQVPTPLNLVVSMDGNVRNYPFDSYSATIISSVETRTGQGAPWVSVPVVVGAEGEIGGWVLSFEAPQTAEVLGASFAVADGYGIQVLGARRAVSTIVLAIMIMLLMVLLAVMTAFVARAVALRLRRVEPSLAGWLAALLFALVPLRNFLPGAPPLGSWIDFLIFFWVEVVIMLSLSIYVATWLRDGPPSDHRKDHEHS